MYYVYILKSLKDFDKYIGSTNDLGRRFQEHQSGQVDSTKNRIPFELIYYEAYKNETDARMREQNLKLRSNSFYQLIKRISRSIGLRDER